MEVSEERIRTRQVLQERAKILAKAAKVDARAEDEIEVALFRVGAEVFGLPVQHLREIVPLPALTRLPSVPEWFLGIAQVRGSLLSVLDLARFTGAKGESEPTHVAVVECTAGPISFTVDQVLNCVHISPSALKQSGERSDRRAALGITADLVVVLDIPRILALPEIIVG